MKAGFEQLNCLKIEITKLSDNSGLKLKLTNNGITTEQTLPINSKNQFDIKKSNTAFKLDQENNVLCIPLPGTKETLKLNVNGDINLGFLNTNTDLELKTEGNITVDKPIIASSLKLKANNISILNELRTEQSLEIDTKGLLENKSEISCLKEISIKGTGVFKNNGRMFSDKNIDFRIGKILNNGELFSRNKISICDFNNFVNSQAGMIKSQDFFSHARGQFINKGKIHLKNAIKMDVDTFINEGYFIGQSIRMRLNNYLHNRGLIEGLEKCDIESRSIIKNSVRGKILSNRDVNLFGFYKLYNFGEITGKSTLRTKANGRTRNAVFGSMSSEDLLIGSTHIFDNEGKANVENLLKIKAGIISNEKGADLSSKGTFDSESNTFLNDSNVSAANLGVKTDVLINKQNGQFIALNNLKMAVRKFLENSNLLYAKNELDIKAKELLNQKDGRIKSDGNVKIDSEIAKNLGEIEACQLFIEIAMQFCNEPLAKLKAKECIELLSKGTVENRGDMTSDDKIVIDATIQLINELNGKVSAEQLLILKSQCSIENRANMLSNGEILISAMQQFANRVDGTVKAKIVHIESNAVINEAIIEATKSLTIEAKLLMENVFHALILAGEKANLFSGSVLLNSGDVHSKGSLLIKANDLLKNLKEGKIIATSDLSLLVNHILSNAGVLLSQKDILLKSNEWITNLIGGKIFANGNAEFNSKYRFDNSGDVNAAKELKIKVETLLFNLKEGKLKAQEAIYLISKMSAENSGLVYSDKVRLKAKEVIRQNKNGVCVAKTLLETQSKNSINAGNYTSYNDAKMKTENLENLKSGVIQATNLLDIESKNLLNFGTIQSLKKLSIKIKETFAHYKNGQLAAKEVIEVFTKNFECLGYLITEGKFDATIENDFDYDTDILCAVGLIKLLIKKGYNFTKPIHTPGGLEIATDPNADITVNTKLIAEGNLTTNSRNLTVNDLMFAGKKMDVNATDAFRLNPGACVASNENMSIKSGTTHNRMGEIHTLGDLLLQALYWIEHSGNTWVEGNTKVIAPLFNHRPETYDDGVCAMALSKKPSFTVAGNCDFGKTQVELLAAILHVGGTLTKEDNNFIVRSFVEYFTQWQTYTIQGPRKGLGKGHADIYYTVAEKVILRILDSHVSTGKKVDFKNLNQLINESAFRTPSMNASTNYFYNGNNIPASELPENFEELIGLTQYFRETKLFGKLDDGASYQYGPLVPFKFPKLNWPPKQHVDSASSKPFSDESIEKFLVQAALQDKLRSGYINNKAGSPTEVLMQLRQNAFDFATKGSGFLIGEQAFRIRKMAGDGNCLFSAVLDAQKRLFKQDPNHIIHTCPDHYVLRLLVGIRLPKRADTIREQIKAVISGQLPLDILPNHKKFREDITFLRGKYARLAEDIDEKTANRAFKDIFQNSHEDYIRIMKLDGTWGGDIELGVLSTMFHLNINVHHVVLTERGYRYTNITTRFEQDSPYSIDLMFNGGHYDVLTPMKYQPLNENDFLQHDKPLMYYKNNYPCLYIPKSLTHSVAMGTANQAVMRAENADLRGGPNSLCHNQDTILVDEHLHMEFEKVINEQRTRTVYETVKSNRKTTLVVPIEQPVPNTGVIAADKLTGKLGTYTQIGGRLHSGKGGTYLEIRDAALIKALRTTEAEQGGLTKSGRNFAIVPVFIPAEITSNGDQTIIVTGPFTAEGLYSKADGKNTLKATHISIKNIKEQFDLPTTIGRKGFMNTKKTASGGTSFSSVPSAFIGEMGLEMVADNTIELINTILLSGGDANLKAKKFIKILNDTAETTTWGKQNKFKGFGYHKQNTKQTRSYVLPSEVYVKGNLTLESELVHLAAVKGEILGDMYVDALSILIEGAVEQQTTTTTTKSLSVSFFGSDALESVMQGKNGRTVVEKMLAQDAFLNALKELRDAKDGGEKLTKAAQTLVEAWRIATTVAQACDRPDGKNEALGAMTDRWGLTRPIKDGNGKVTGREFNPTITFNFNQSKITETHTRTIPTTLLVGGTVHFVANIIRLLDGTVIQAENIQLHARQLLEIHAAKNTHTTHQNQSGGSVSITASGVPVGASVHASGYESETVRYQNANLKARNLLSILSGVTSIKGGGLQGKNVLIKSATLVLESLQDTHDAKGKSGCISVGENSAGIHVGTETEHSKWVKDPTFIEAEGTLDAMIDYLSQKGSILTAKDRLKVKGLKGPNPIEWNVEDIKDFHDSRSHKVHFGFNGKQDSFPVVGAINGKTHKKAGVTRATAAAPNIEGTLPAEINTDLNKAQEVLKDKKRSTGAPILCFNFSKIAQDKKSIEDAFGNASKNKPSSSAASKDVGKSHNKVKAENKKPNPKPSNENINSDKKPQKISGLTIEQRKELAETLKKAGITVSVDEYIENPEKYTIKPDLKQADSGKTLWKKRLQKLNIELRKFKRIKAQYEIDCLAGCVDSLTFGLTEPFTDKIADKNSMAYFQGEFLSFFVPVGAALKGANLIYKGFKTKRAAELAYKLKIENRLTARIKNYLENVENVPWEQVLKDLETMGLKNKSKLENWPNFIDSKAKTRAMLHRAEHRTPYDHLHLYNNKGKSLDKNLKTVNPASKDAHIKIKQKEKNFELSN